VGPSREPDHDDNPADERLTRRRWFHRGVVARLHNPNIGVTWLSPAAT